MHVASSSHLLLMVPSSYVLGKALKCIKTVSTSTVSVRNCAQTTGVRALYASSFAQVEKSISSPLSSKFKLISSTTALVRNLNLCLATTLAVGKRQASASPHP